MYINKNLYAELKEKGNNMTIAKVIYYIAKDTQQQTGMRMPLNDIFFFCRRLLKRTDKTFLKEFNDGLDNICKEGYGEVEDVEIKPFIKKVYLTILK